MAKKTKKPPKTTKKSGRPKWSYKIDNDIAEKMCSVFAMDWTITEACQYAGIDEKTRGNRIKKQVYFFREIVVVWKNGLEEKKLKKILYEDAENQAKALSIIIARKAVYKEIQNWNWKQAMKLLEKRDDRYKPKLEVFEGDEVNEEDLTD